jgi:hypothetical protein
MASQAHVDDVLTALETLVAEIAPLRTQADSLRREVAQARKDYEQALRALNDETERLTAKQNALRARLKSREPMTATSTTAGLRTSSPSAPAPVLPSGQPVVPIAPVSVPTDPRAERKRALADFIISVVDSAQETVVRERLNIVLADTSRDIGDMLEDLSWGPIWSARSEWETLDEQAARLEAWRASLTARRSHWQRELIDLERDGRKYFLPERRQRAPTEWLAFLGDLAKEQQTENARLLHEVEVLERQLSARRAGGGRDE